VAEYGFCDARKIGDMLAHQFVFFCCSLVGSLTIFTTMWWDMAFVMQGNNVK